MNQVTDHVKKITKQNDELYKTINRHEQRLLELDQLLKNESNTDTFATREDVGRLIDDIQNSFEVVLNATPRNTNEINNMRSDFQILRDDITKIRNEIETLKRVIHNVPAVSSLDADTVEKNLSSKPPLAVKSLNFKKDIILRKNI